MRRYLYIALLLLVPAVVLAGPGSMLSRHKSGMVTKHISERHSANFVTGTDSDMSGANNWDSIYLTVNTTTVPGKLYILGQNIGSSDYATLPGVFPLVASYVSYRVSLKARLKDGESTSIYVGQMSLWGSGDLLTITPTGTEQVFTGTIRVINSTSLDIGNIAGFAGISFEVDDVSVTTIIRPVN